LKKEQGVINLSSSCLRIQPITALIYLGKARIAIDFTSIP